MTDGLLLIHGWPLDASMWADQVSALQGDLPVMAPNMPGFGGAPPGGAVLGMDAGAAAATGAVADAGLDRVVVCGLSMGGYVGLALWRRHRELVSGFVFANTRAAADDEAGKERRRAVAERLRAEGNRFLVESPPPLLSEDADPQLWRKVKDGIAAQPAEAIAAAAVGMAERPDSTGDLATIDVPTLVVTGSGDTLIPPDATRPMAEGIRGARFEVIDAAGHLSNLERPDRFTELLREHLRACGL
ncbi:MAG: alpha/beta fold hydrolase [Actinomycetota bacterium]